MSPDLAALRRRLEAEPENPEAALALARALAQTGALADAYLLLYDRKLIDDQPVAQDIAARLAAEQRPVLETLLKHRVSFSPSDDPDTDRWTGNPGPLNDQPVLGLRCGIKDKEETFAAAARITTLRVLSQTNSPPEGALLALRACQHLRSLNYWGSEPRAPAHEIAQLETLERLHLRLARGLTDESVLPLASLPRLRHLDLESALITDHALRALSEASELRFLNLAHCRAINAVGFDALGALSKLTHLDVSVTAFDDLCLEACAALPALEELLLVGTEVSAEGLMQLAGSKSLRRLTLGAAMPEVEALKEALPRLEVHWLL